MDHPVSAVILPPGPRLFQLLTAALDGDGAPAICPISPELPGPARTALLAALNPTWVETPGGVHRYERSGEPGGRPVASEVAVLIATSGSTGEPKIVELSASALRHSARASLDRIGAAPGERWLCCLPTSHIAGLQVLVRALVAGSTPVIHPRFDIDQIIASAADPGGGAGGGPHLSLVPTQLRRLLAAGVDLSRLGTILLGGGHADPDLLATADARGGRVVTTYGMSETCGGCVYDGRPLEGVRVAVGAADGRIRLAGPVLFSGYRHQPHHATGDGNDGDWDGEWLVTQDLGVLEDGVLRVRGRADDVINTGGEKVVATEVAAVLAQHRAVREVVVVGRRDREWGERVTAVVVPAGEPPTLGELRAWVRGWLPAHAAPRELELVAAIPLLASGKPDRERLRRA